MKIGRTIGAKRDQVESESERLLYRQKVKRRKLVLVMTYLIILMIIALGIISIVMGIKKRDDMPVNENRTEASPTIEIIDEASVGVPRKVKEFVGFLEQDLKEYGITLSKAVLPRNKTREIDVYTTDFEGYFKLSLDRGTGVAAEDMDRIIRHLKKQGMKGAEYVDLRVEGKAYYKNAVPTEEKQKEEQKEEPVESTEELVEDTEEEPQASSEETEVIIEVPIEETTEVPAEEITETE